MPNLKPVFDRLAKDRDRYFRRHRYAYSNLLTFLNYAIPHNASVIELGCGTGGIIGRLRNEKKTGIDFSEKMVERARVSNPGPTYLTLDIEHLAHDEKYDYILLIDTINSLNDVQRAFNEIGEKLTHRRSRLIITYYNFLWEPLLKFARWIGLIIPLPNQSWFSHEDVATLLDLADFEVVTRGQRLLIPFYIPLVSWIANTYLAQLPLIRALCVVQYIIARPRLKERREYSVSIIIAARNEAGNIERALKTIPRFGTAQEIIFVEGGSTDNTWETLQEMAKKYEHQWKIVVLKQPGKGLANAYHTALPRASNELIMILNGDLTVDPSDLPKFYEAFAEGKGDFINGSRMVYPMEKRAMPIANMIANKGFGMVFSWLLGQRLKDTLCGTKVFLRADWERMEEARVYFGDFDPFGDFEFLFGASKLNLRIIDLPIRYHERTYGSTNILRWRFGVLLSRMCIFAARKMKFI